ncbi:spore coat protein [Bacillus spizizenii]|uniref:spore coat protein n=2 Tax=Bacillus spizizenii TaxID=96241 RepID=UPI001E36BDE4|nr:spore coat protein [Bacillus spizizenii]MCM3415577.1 spore coat protein [Bacillus spizizenii]MCY7988904.1 spore coat protein [Bacillus spizizenii]MCY7996034.1 spore coat protein [Bacillus spizizenii]MCY8059344.1 spore coat protein [Bacillus spizizenii]MCY8128460.1 spore coat protein [Bacillus spizizenii]
MKPLNDFPAPIIPIMVLDCLTTIQTSIKKYTVAITETTNPDLRTALHDQLDAAVHLHGELSELLMEKGWILSKPFQIDLLLY